jgi:uncharacterized Fe-S cluster protein YjdI
MHGREHSGHAFFSSQLMEQRERSYTNGEITVYWKPGACIHSSICYTRLLEVFNPRKRPWVNMAGAASQTIIDVVNHCPTEALTWKYNDEGKNELLTAEDKNHIRIRRPEYNKKLKESAREIREIISDKVEIRIMQNGPMVVKGNFRVISSSGTELKPMKMSSFCRCGYSRNMPYCDGTHRKVAFNDET